MYESRALGERAASRTVRGPTLLALAVVALLFASVLAVGHASGPATSSAPNAASAAAPATPSVSPSVSTAPAAGACTESGNSARAAGDLAPSAASTPAGTAPGPLFNSAMQPFATVTGPYSYVAGGAALRDQGYGQIDLTWPGSSTLVAAYMLWSILDDNVPADNGTLNGYNVTGTWTAYATPSPCWAPTYIYTFVADVTDYIANGENALTGFPSGITDGGDPWSEAQVVPMDEGASLIAIFQNGTALNQVTIYSGALPIGGDAPDTQTSQLNYSNTNSSTAQTTYIVADGQLPDNAALWNGSVVDANAFYGSDPHESSATWSYGNLSDTRTFYNLPVTVGSNNTTAAVASGGSDCLTWVGQVLSVGVAAKKGPYPVTFVEQGLPSGTEWSVATDSTTTYGTSGLGPSPIVFSLENGTYTFTVGTLAGYLIQPAQGSYVVAGGPFTIRIIFHALVYPIEFVETGLPAGDDWSIALTNASQDLSSGLTASAGYGNIWFNESNGTYHFEADEAGLYVAVPASGNVTLSGSAVTVTINFVPPPLYQVTFVEQNLTAGTLWGADVYTNWGDFYNETTSDAFALELPNATLGFDYLDTLSEPGYVNPTYLQFAVNGAPETVYVNFTLQFGVWVNETGLPTGTTWSVYLEGADYSDTVYAENSTNFVALTNGSFTFYVNPIYAWVATPSTGSIHVDGAWQTIWITFTPAPTYALTFYEKGLPSGTPWTVELDLPNDSEVRQTSTGTSIAFSESNGTYYYWPTAAGWAANVTEGYLYIDGEPLNVDIGFSQLFTVTFVETGLPTGTYWAVDYADAYNYSLFSTIVFYEPNGSYTFYAYETDGFTPNPDTTTSLDVSGANLTQVIAYSSSTGVFSITLTETGLPAGTNWSVTLNDFTLASTTASIVYYEENGTYDFSVPSVDSLAANPSSGSIIVAGANETQPIAFGAPPGTFEVTFSETGLPNLATWYINITGQTGLSATVDDGSGISLVIALANASYTYTAATNAAGWTASGGGFTVDGVSQTIPVPFSSSAPATKYLVTFDETGLPDGATWYVNISGESLSATVSAAGGTSVSISLVDGSYTYTAATSWSNWTAPSGGGFSVSGSAKTVDLGFTASSPATGKPATNGLGGLALWLGLALLAIVVVLLLILLARRRRKKWTPAEEGPTPPSGAPPPPPPPPPGGS